MALFSVIMPAYNAEKYISEAIESVLKQEFEDWELVIVDDGSSDNTYNIANQYAKECKKIVLVTQPNSGTAAAARTTALKYVSGEYVQVLDADDWLSADCLKKYAIALENTNNKIDAISPICVSANDKRAVLGEVAQVSKFVGTQVTGLKAFEYSLDWTIHGVICIKTSILKRIGYDKDLVNGDEFSTRKLLFSCKNIYFTDAVYYYRKNEDSTTKSTRNQYRMSECVITGGNIFNFAVDKKLGSSILKKCYVSWVKLLYLYLYKNIESSDWVREHKEYSTNILHKEFSKISNCNYRFYGNPYCLGVYLTFNNFRMFRFVAFLAGKLYDILKS